MQTCCLYFCTLSVIRKPSFVCISIGRNVWLQIFNVSSELQRSQKLFSGGGVQPYFMYVCLCVCMYIYTCKIKKLHGASPGYVSSAEANRFDMANQRQHLNSSRKSCRPNCGIASSTTLWTRSLSLPMRICFIAAVCLQQLQQWCCEETRLCGDPLESRMLQSTQGISCVESTHTFLSKPAVLGALSAWSGKHLLWPKAVDKTQALDEKICCSVQPVLLVLAFSDRFLSRI